ncbi:type VII secretion system-associated protein [Streptomyces sp. SCL15-6]|uniref:type VII secretion system-associated protein n=1 Tax=Streptomyces sp. SCL15-6 TaxID=2967222 RepID=UPI00296729B4|nr:type VII secretion system-associated protein [Streptomyces sp. SCL15-6]
MVDLTKLDAQALQSFIDNDVHQFKTDIVTLRTSQPALKSLYDIANSTAPLAIGALAGDTDTGGKNVTGNTTTAARAIDTVLNRHAVALDDLERNLRNVITTMLKTQGSNLEQVDGEKFLTAIGPYDTDMSGDTSGGASQQKIV